MLTPDEIKSREFLVSLRGYDRDEVHSFLAKVAEEMEQVTAAADARVKQLEAELQRAGTQPQPAPAAAQAAPAAAPAAPADPSVLFAEIGRETQRILEAAQEAGTQMQRRARQDADRELQTARGQAARLVAEGERRREGIERVVRALDEARAALATDLRNVGRTIEHTLRDLAPTETPSSSVRKAMETEAKIAADRDREAGAGDDEDTEPSGTAETEAVVAEEPTAEEMAVVAEEPTAEEMAVAEPEPEPAAEPEAEAISEPEQEAAAEPEPAAEPEAAEVAEPESEPAEAAADSEAAPETEAAESGTEESAEAGADTEQQRGAGPALAAALLDESEAEPARTEPEAAAQEAEASAPEETADASAQTADEAAPAAADEPGEAAAAVVTPSTARTTTVARDPAGLRASALSPLHPKLVRKLKRELQEVQNISLDRVRRAGGRGDVDDFLPQADEAAGMGHGAEEFLQQAWRAGVAAASTLAERDFGEGGDAPELTGAFTDEATERVRSSLSATLRMGLSAGEPAQALSDRIGAVFSELKGTSAEELAATHLIRAYELGLLGTWTRGGVPARQWVLGREPRCPEARCRQNDQSGPLALGESFPSGHDVPPVHVGCTCTTIPVLDDGA